jgi:putative CocE/NonD family hydrolase
MIVGETKKKIKDIPMNVRKKYLLPAFRLYAPLFSVLLFLPLGFAEGQFAVKVDTGVRVDMRDGVALVADVYRPDADGEFAVLLQRTPYNRKGGTEQSHELASHGYMVVVQDTRGRFDSEGEFYPFRHEPNDGYDTVEWAAMLPGSNGQVGMYGGSYVGATQMLAAIRKPPHLVAIMPFITASEYYDGWTYQSGALMQWFASSWTSGLAVDTLRREAEASLRPKDWAWQMPVESYRLLSLPSATDVAPYFRDWIRHETDNEYWKKWKISDHYPELTVKALHMGGWHDIFLKGSIKNYIGLRKSAKTTDAREAQRLLVGPWAHAGTSEEGKIGDVVFGTQAVLDYTQTILNWFDYSLKGVNNEYASGAPVRLFVMGENVWRDEQEFPLRRARTTKYYLHSNGSANSIRGDGMLNTESAQGAKPDRFEYDPANPVPTIGGRLCCGNDVLPPGPFDQRPNESRSDVLVYSTPPLEKDTEVTGYITLELYAATTASDTDFTAMLVDVDPSGYARFLTDGIVRGRYRSSTARVEPIVSGKVYRYDIDLWVTSNVFKTGHQIRLYVSSSNFPRFNRNPNTGESTLGATGMVKATQTIYHDQDRPSALLLPIVPR